MRHRRHTITVASSTLFFVCLVLHAQTGLYPQASTRYNDAEARKVYESLLPADWTLTVAHARRLLIQATGNSARSHIALSPVAFNIDTVVYARHNFCLLSGGDAFYVLEKKDGICESMRWRGTSCAWAS
jgi:hypothetical protein